MSYMSRLHWVSLGLWLPGLAPAMGEGKTTLDHEIETGCYEVTKYRELRSI
jgi:hypothetical protein